MIAKTNRGPVEYSLQGKGKAIFFLHGGHSNCRETLFHKGLNAREYQLITPSRPGYGNTPLGDHATPEKSADLMISLLDQLEIEQVIPYGISAGGLTAIEMAAKYPHRVEKLILASAVSKMWLDPEGKVYKTAHRLFNPRSEKWVWGIIRLFSGIFPRIIANSFYPQFSNNKPHKLDRNDISELVATFKHFSSGNGFMSDVDHNINVDRLSQISCPTLIIHSKNDSSVSFDHAEHAHRMIPNSVLTGLDNEWGHLFWIGKDSVNALLIIQQFLKG